MAKIAPPVGNVRWLQVAEADGEGGPDVEGLRGRVVIVQTYGHYCDP